MSHIKRLTRDDWQSMRGIRLRALQDSPEAFSSNLELESSWDETEWIKRFDNRDWFLADVDGSAVGIAGSFAPPNHPEGQYHLIGMWVDPDHRGSGVAEELVRSVQEHIQNIDGHKLSLLIVPNNAIARKFYERMGFSLEQSGVTLETNPGEIYDELSMSL